MIKPKWEPPYIEDTIRLSDVEIMEFRSLKTLEHHLRVRVYYKTITLITRPLRKALQGMKE